MNDTTMVKENPEILRVQELTRQLERMNREVEGLLARLPLPSHEEVARLDRLINEQSRLAGSPLLRALPPRVSIFFENARDKAGFLRQRYHEALENGKLRKPKT